MTTNIIPEFEMNYRHFLDRTVNLYGGSGSGKSFIIKDVLSTLREHIDQVIVFNPTDRSNGTYSKNGLVPLPCIHYEVKPETLQNIWDRQMALASVYTRVHDPDVINRLFNRIPNIERARQNIEAVKNKIPTYVNEIKNTETDGTLMTMRIEDIEAKGKRLIEMIYQKEINRAASYLMGQNLDEQEKYSLKFINLNPRMLIIFDDCTDMLYKIRNNPVIQKFYYQGRWAFLTILTAAHTDKAMLPEIKKNCFVSIFTENVAARSYFERKSNDLSKEDKHNGDTAIKQSFTPLMKHQKLIWLREHRKFYKYTAKPHDMSGFVKNNYLKSYLREIVIDENAPIQGNKYMSGFQ